MDTYQTTLLNRSTVGAGITILTVSKPDGFRFSAGQFVALAIPALPAEHGQNWRWMSIASAPSERELIFVLADSDSAYKRYAATCPIGSTFEISSARGKFILDRSDRIVLLAGGVGIAPVRGMLIDAAASQRRGRLHLFYSCSTPNDFAFSELFSGQLQLDLIFVPTVTGADHSNGEWGRIDSAMLQRYIDDLRSCHYYAVGSPDFVKAMIGMLRHEQVDFDQLTVENFTGL